ncbi:MAG TPA: inorganic diphosphatase [Coprococcus sp.]|nr:inorganic diphosphatase [Coprococcus sp.]
MHNVPTDEVFVIGHKNPDTDSICSAIAYAHLKNQHENKYIPKRAGNINKETQFVLDYFGVQAPALVSNVNVQVKDIAYRIVDGVSGDITMKRAFEIMQDNDATTLPVVNNGKIKGIITVGDIAEAYMLEKDDNSLFIAGTKFSHIIDTINGELVYGDADEYVKDGRVIVGAAQVDILERHVKENDIVIVSDRVEAQLAAINCGASMLIVCLVNSISDVVLEFAKNKGCAVVVTPTDTYAVARLIGQSMPIGFFMIRDRIMTFYEDDDIDTLKTTMAKTRVRYFPVTDGYGNYKGLVSRRNYINARKKQVILVDHNERTQSVDNIDKAEIREIIDHHRIGSVETVSPVYFRNQPVGCTGTIIAQMYREQGIEITKEMAGLMCSAILSDTLMFRSPTCTPVDEQIARELAAIAGVDVEEHAKAMFRAGSDLSGKTPNEIFYMDYKKFNADTINFGVGQITSMDQGELDDIKAPILEYMDSVKEEQGLDYVFFMLTNILEETTHLLICGPDAEGVIERGFDVTPEDKIAVLPGVMSRKKQMIPNLLNAFQQ